MGPPRAGAATPWRPASRACVKGLLAVLASIECEVRGLPDWVLERDDEPLSPPPHRGAAVAPASTRSRG